MIHNNIERLRMKRGDSLMVHFKRQVYPGANVVAFVSNHDGLTTQEVWTRLHYNRPYVSKRVTDKAFPGVFFYKHQMLAAKLSFIIDSMMIVHDPGTGKTITLLHSMMELLKARAITKIWIINNSDNGNRVAIDTLIKRVYKYYESYFNIPVDQFIRKAIHTTTNQRIKDELFANNYGIILDEAHNLLSDSNQATVMKNDNFNKFINSLSKLHGIKLMLSTATPLFGDPYGAINYNKLLLRGNVTVDDIQTSMSSFTQVNYKHLRVVQMLNGYYAQKRLLDGRIPRENELDQPLRDPTPEETGDLSFILSNGFKYLLNVWLNKPSPIQIADLAKMANDDTPNTFQCKGKPMIIASNPRIINGKTVIQSTMLDSMIQEIDKITYGTVVVYSELVGKGSLTVAEYLKSHGWELYTGKGNTARANNRRLVIDPLRDEQSNISNNLTLLEDNIFQLHKKLHNTSLIYLNKLYEQLNGLQDSRAHESIISSFTAYVAHYKELAEIDQITLQELQDKEEELADLRDRYRHLTNERHNDERIDNKKCFIIFSSTMTLQQRMAVVDFNSEDNWDGSKIRVVAGSKAMRDGIDFKHVVQTHVLGSEWRIPGIVQAQHRGIRSNGHDTIIHCLSEKMVKENPGMTYDEAQQIVINNKIEVKIYHHYVSVDLLDEIDIQNAREYLDDDLKELTNKEILSLLVNKSSKHGAGAIMYRTAINTHKEVGSSMMRIWKNSIDYKLNVNQENRLKLQLPNDTEDQCQVYTKDKLIGIMDTELFYMNDYTNSIILKITELLLHYGKIDTDLIFKIFLEPDDSCKDLLSVGSVFDIDANIIVTDAMIATSIVEITTYKKYIYNSKIGINMLVSLYETDEESILYLSTTVPSPGVHPYSMYVDTIGYTVTHDLERNSTRITLDDLKLPKNHQTIYKLKDLIKRAMDGNDALSQVEITFLSQMSNYWGFSWKDLTSPTMTKTDMSVYIFEGHIPNPNINILAKDLTIYEYRPTTKAWRITTALGLKGAFIVRYASLVYLYKDFRFYDVPEFASHQSFKNNIAVINDRDPNGIILVKGYYDPDFDKNTLVDKLLSKPNVLIDPIGRSVLVKKFTSSQSRGSQILQELPKGINTTRIEAINYLNDIARRDITLFFFLYSKDTFERGISVDILDIKKKEMKEMIKAIRGLPSPRFQIDAVETADITSAKRQEIYKLIYKLPNDLSID